MTFRFGPSVLVLPLVSVLAVGVACEPPPPMLDAMVSEALVRSAERVRADLPPDRRGEFDSLLVLAVHGGEVRAELDTASAELDKKLRQRLTGVRLEGLRAVADSLRRRHLNAEISTLQNDSIFARIDAEQPHGLVVLDARMRYPYEGLSGYLDITLENRLEDVVFTEANFHIKQIIPGRTLPFNKMTDKVEFRGGLEPGERRTFRHEIPSWELGLHDWSFDNVPDDAEIRLEPYSVGTADSSSLDKAMVVPDSGRGRLDSMRAQLERMEAELDALTSEEADGGGGAG